MATSTGSTLMPILPVKFAVIGLSSRPLTIALTVPSVRMFQATVPSSRSSVSAALQSSTAAVRLHPANTAIAIPMNSAQNNVTLLRIGISFLLHAASSNDENAGALRLGFFREDR